MKNIDKCRPLFWVTVADATSIDQIIEAGEKHTGCTRVDAHEMLDDLTDPEFEIIKAVLGHLHRLEERLPTPEANKRLFEKIKTFLTGKQIRDIAHLQGTIGPSFELEFTDGTSLSILHLVAVPDAIGFLCREATDNS